MNPGFYFVFQERSRGRSQRPKPHWYGQDAPEKINIKYYKQTNAEKLLQNLEAKQKFIILVHRLIPNEKKPNLVEH